MRDMQTRTLGRNGPTVSALGLGCMGMSEFYGPHSDAESLATLAYALDRGVTFLDTADVYGPYTNEELVGRALQGRRAEAFIATKFGFVRDADNPTARAVDGRPGRVRAACDGSLKRLKVEYIDLYYLHRVDPTVPIEDTVGAMGELVKAGKVKALGLSEAKPETISRAHKTHPIAAVQSEYSLLYRQDAEATLATTRPLGIAYIAYSPLGRSLLTGAVRQASDIPEGDGRGRHPRFAADNLARNLQLVAAIESLAKAKGCTAGQVALAWLLAQGNDIVPIPGTKRPERVDQNLAALGVQLSADEAARLSAALPPGAAAGGRYPDGGMKAVYL